MQVIAYQFSDPLLDKIDAFHSWETCDRDLGIPDRIYHDLGQRHQRDAMLVDCRQTPPDRLLVRSMTELGDSLSEISQILGQLEQLGIEVFTLDSDDASFSLQEGDIGSLRDQLAQLLEVIQTQQRSQRRQQGHARNRLQALPPPGKAPYGYRRGRDRYLIDRSTAPVVKEFFEQFLLYGSLRRAVRYLEKRYGKSISVSTGRRWLSHPVYRGDLLYQTGEILADTHAPILQREEAAQIDRLLRRNQSLPPRTASAPRSLAGLVQCQTCQSAMTITRVSTRGTGKEYLYLRPMQCTRQPHCKAISYQAILEKTIQRICEDLPVTVNQLSLPDMDGIKEGISRQIDHQRSLIEQITTLLTQGILDEATATLRQYNLRAAIAQLQAQLDQLPPGNLKVIAQAVSLPEFWLDLSESERRFYFREFIRKIQIIRSLDSPEQSWQLKLQFVF